MTTTPVTPSSVCDSEREAFEASMKAMEGYPFAGAFANLMWKSWQARAALAERTQQEAISPIQPAYYVQHLGGSYSLADPQPLLSNRKAPVQPNDEAASNEARLHRAARTIAVQAGEEPQKFIDWLCDGGLVQMALSHFGPTKVEASEPEKGKGPQPFGCGPSGNQLASEKIGGVGTDKSYTQTSAPPPPSSSDALTEFHRWRLLRVVENTQGNRRLWVAGFKAGRGQA